MNWSGKSKSARSSIEIAFKWLIVSLILLAALILLSLQGCSTRSGVFVMDSRLTAPCDRPVLQGSTNRDVWRLAVEQQEALTDCADRIDAIRSLTR